MKSLLSRIWIFDFDGTISNLVPQRDAAALDPACRSLLTQLADDPNQVVAVISSRTLTDLMSRVDIDHVIVAGSSGLEWLIAGTHRIGPNARAVDRLERERQRLVPVLCPLEKISGVEIEDKTWSVAIHFRHADAAGRRAVANELGKLQLRHEVTVHYGPEVAEVQFLAEVSKEIAVKTLLRLNKAGFDSSRLLYAGDDQNDALAMKWVMAHHGTAYVVGGRISVAGAHMVDNPAELARVISRECLRETCGKQCFENRYE